MLHAIYFNLVLCLQCFCFFTYCFFYCCYSIITRFLSNKIRYNLLHCCFIQLTRIIMGFVKQQGTNDCLTTNNKHCFTWKILILFHAVSKFNRLIHHILRNLAGSHGICNQQISRKLTSSILLTQPEQTNKIHIVD